MNVKPHLILASQSPARKNLLNRSGITPEIIVSGINEEAPEYAALSPGELAYELAYQKALAVHKNLTPQINTFIIACDSVFEIDGMAYGKPEHPDIAITRLNQMKGRAGQLHTGHALIESASGRCERALATTNVKIVDMSELEIRAYVNSGEPLQVAGSFTIDSLGGPFVESVTGDPSNVEGLSLPTLRMLFARFGIGWEHFLT